MTDLSLWKDGPSSGWQLRCQQHWRVDLFCSVRRLFLTSSAEPASTLLIMRRPRHCSLHGSLSPSRLLDSICSNRLVANFNVAAYLNASRSFAVPLFIMPPVHRIIDPDLDPADLYDDVEEEAERALSNNHTNGVHDKHGRSEYMHRTSLRAAQLVSRLRSSSTQLLLAVAVVAVLGLLVSNSSVLSSLSYTQHLSHGGLFLTQQRTAQSFSLPSTFTAPAYPSLASLVHASPSSYAGLSKFVQCTAKHGRVAVFVTSTNSFTAAHISLGLLESPWCMLVLSTHEDGEGRWERSIQAGVADHLAKQALSKAHRSGETEAALSLDRKAILARTAFLSRAEQSHLPYTINGLSSTPAASKNLGYLLAMHAGATVIFDGDDSHVYLPATSRTGSADLPVEEGGRAFLSSSRVQQRVEGQVEDGSRAGSQSSVRTVPIELFNPYPLYGGTSAWPRGFPLSFASATLQSDRLLQRHLPQPHFDLSSGHTTPAAVTLAGRGCALPAGDATYRGTAVIAPGCGWRVDGGTAGH